MYKILAINPGSTSTKISLYEDDREIFTEDLPHPHAELLKFVRVTDQLDFRKNTILDTLRAKGVADLSGFAAVVSRGGLIHPVQTGVYAINDAMAADLKAGVQGEHAANVGGLIALELSRRYGMPCYIVDPPVVDEVDDYCKITGLKEVRRKVISHALSQVASAKRYAVEQGTVYDALNLVVAHLGGGISVGAHRKGRYADVNDALSGEGPFSPERSGTLPLSALLDMCFSGRYTYAEMKKKVKGQGGLMSLLGTADFREVERRILSGDAEAERAGRAMAYRIAREISSLWPAFRGETVNQVILTGGLAKSRWMTDIVTGFLKGLNTGVTVYPGENEMRALALGCLRALMGQEKVKVYEGR
ncbi:MAG: butyrate kinase [Fibrobacterota bacterium]